MMYNVDFGLNSKKKKRIFLDFVELNTNIKYTAQQIFFCTLELNI